ncbi:heterokaryon incompatibility protein-domain-containing protein [Ganoderma leucocontextum]|nr:heterokaryon incompatibility protein-domain-containing protein [Ganoderma leucocontextum]
MWVPSTDRAELHYFITPEAIVGGYAILSHTWSPTGEQTLQEVRAIGERCQREGTNPRDYVDPKVRGCCLMAEKEGFRWVWIDSCCIDKTSSTELSESINSMFEWYSQAEVCYAYLADVPRGCILHAQDSAFRRSRWHTRGWTLQELIAPAVVVFFSGEWREIGTKATLCGLLSQITGIPWTVFTRQRLFSQFSVAQRMYWAVGRSTTRLEDEAYSLMGLFGVSIPTNYGEGHNAFYRLQREILRHSSDMTLFAWGPIIGECCGFGSEDTISSGVGDAFRYLLASSPKNYESPSVYTPTLVKCEHVQQTYPSPIPDSTQESQATKDHRNGPFDRVELPQVIFTSYGVECRLPLFDAGDVTIAVLLCQLPSREHVGLVLMRDPSARDIYRPRYHASCRLRRAKPHSGINSIVRLVTLGRDLHNIRFDGAVVQPEWRTIYIATSPPAAWTSTRASIARLSFNCSANPFVHFPHWLLSRLAMLGFRAIEQTCAHRHGVRFIHHSGEHITVEIGVCSSHPRGLDRSPTQWARVSCRAGCPGDESAHVHDAHDCSEDHVLSWPMWTKDFGTKERTVRLSFVPHERAQKSTLVVHLELKGTTYENMLHKAQVAIPSQEELDMTRAFPQEPWADMRRGLHLRESVGYRQFLRSQMWRLGPSDLGLGLCGPSSTRSHKPGRILITHAHPGHSHVPFIAREEFRLAYPYVELSAGRSILDNSSRIFGRDTWSLD